MKTNNFSFNRIGMLYRHSWLLNSKKLSIIGGGLAVLIAIFYTIIHLATMPDLERNVIDKFFHLIVFVNVLMIAGILWNGIAFPYLRTKEGTMSYLMLPSSTLEKYAFEFLNRIVLFLIVFPAGYMIIVNTISSIFHSYYPGYEHYQFTLSMLFPEFLTAKEYILVISVGLFCFIIPYTGATIFRKLPLLKTLIIVFILIAFFSLYIYLIAEKAGLNNYQPIDNRVLWISNEEDLKLTAILGFNLGSMVLLLIGYYKLKEKEV